MADIKFLLPEESTGNLKQDFESLKTKFISVLKELEYALGNLDEENVSRAASVYAENIDTTHAKITNAQIGNLSADKLTSGEIDAGKINVTNLSADMIQTGTLDTSNVAIASGNNRLMIDESLLRMYDSTGTLRFMMGLDTRPTLEDGKTNPYYNQFCLFIIDENGSNTIYFDDDGNAIFAGKINTKESVSVGERIVMQNCRHSNSGIFFTSGSQTLGSISVEGDSPRIELSAPNGVYVSGSKLATEDYVNQMFGSSV